MWGEVMVTTTSVTGGAMPAAPWGETEMKHSRGEHPAPVGAVASRDCSEPVLEAEGCFQVRRRKRR